MSEPTHPGVFVEEAPFGLTTIEGVATSTAGFVGAAEAGPTDEPVLVAGVADFESAFGKGGELWHAARAFFAQGGARLYVQRVVDGDYEAGLRALERVDEIAIVAAPGAPVAEALFEHAERMRDRFAIVDPGRGQTVEEVTALRDRLDSSYAALYYPWLRVRDPGDGGEIAVPPSGFVAGLYARSDALGAHAGAAMSEPLVGAVGVETVLDERAVELLVSQGINPIRAFPDGAIRVWGARTLSSDPEWKYVPVRRLLIFVEASLDRGTQWAVFEPNDEPLWEKLRQSCSNFLLTLFRAGALTGATAAEAFFVRCDRTTMTQDDLNAGRVVCLVGVAPIRPAEFVVLRIGQWTADHGCR